MTMVGDRVKTISQGKAIHYVYLYKLANPVLIHPHDTRDHLFSGKDFPCLGRAFLRDAFLSALRETKINDGTDATVQRRKPLFGSYGWTDRRTDGLLACHVAAFGRTTGWVGDRIWMRRRRVR